MNAIWEGVQNLTLPSGEYDGYSADQVMTMIGSGEFNNMSTAPFDALLYQLNTSVTGCLRQGALPVALAANDTCLPGFYCPNSSDGQPPQYCPPTESCQVYRSNKAICPRAQGLLEPVICGNGVYCPVELGGKKQLPCPAGTFCPQGSIKPFKCDFGALCPAGSSRQIELLPLFLMIIIDIFLAILVLFGFRVSKWRKRNPRYSTLGKYLDDVELLKRRPGHSRSPSDQSISLPARARSPSLQDPSFARGRSPSLQDPSFARGRSPNLQTTPFIPRRELSPALSVSDYGSPQLNAHDYDVGLGLEDESTSNPDMQNFLRSLASAIHTQDIGLSFDFENLAYEVKGKKKIISGITGSIPRGSMTGIMGGSGAGKSTFFNVLMGKTKHTEGSIKINGWRKDMSKYKKLVGYVPQDDIVLPELTVRENILHSARCRLPAKWRDVRIQSFVDSLISCLALTHVQHSRVGDVRKPVISGGQRKRVSIGIELAAAPMAIFLDEPTSGLDATSAQSIMQMLRAISTIGVTTISIIHQPREEIFSAFDSILLLGHGRQVYNGPTEDVQSYFTSLGFAFPPRGNPADTIMDIINGDGFQYTRNTDRHETDVPFLINFWDEEGQFGKMGKHLSIEDRRERRVSNNSIQSTASQERNLTVTMKARGATWPAQVYYCFKRAMVQQIRTGSSFFFEIGVGALAGGLIGLSAFVSSGHLFQGIYKEPFTILSSAVDYDSVPQLGLLAAMAIGLAASAPGVHVFGEEKLVYYREAASGQSRSAYYVGKVLSTIGRLALSALHFSVFTGVLATPLMSFTEMYCANLVYFYAVYGFASMVSMAVKREDGPLLAVLSSLIIGVLGGVSPPLAKVRQWHLVWLWRLSPGVWFVEAYFSQNLLPLGHVYWLDLASQTVGFTLGQYKLDILMVLAIGSVYRIIAFLGLILIDRQKQK